MTLAQEILSQLLEVAGTNNQNPFTRPSQKITERTLEEIRNRFSRNNRVTPSKMRPSHLRAHLWEVVNGLLFHFLLWEKERRPSQGQLPLVNGWTIPGFLKTTKENYPGIHPSVVSFFVWNLWRRPRCRHERREGERKLRNTKIISSPSNVS